MHDRRRRRRTTKPPAGAHPSARPRLVLGMGLALIALGVALALSRSPPSLIRANAPVDRTFDFGRSSARSRICQGGEVLPRETTSIRIWLEADVGPRVSVQATAHGRVLASGTRAAGWTAGSLTIPVRPVRQTVSGATVCVNVAQAREPVGLQGVRTPRALAAFDRQAPQPGHGSAYREGPLPGRFMIEYLRPGDRSWWSLIPSVARRVGLGHAVGGSWLALLALALTVGAGALATRLVLKEAE